MTADGHTVVDVDAHYVDHMSDIYSYLDESDPWRKRFELATTKGNPEEGDLEGLLGTEQQLWPVVTQNRPPQGIRRPEMNTKEDVIEQMEMLNVDKIILIGEQMLELGAMLADDQRPIKYTQAYVDHLLDNIADVDKEIYITVPVIHSDPEAAVEQINRVADEEAVIGVCVVANGGEPPFGNRRYDPIYEACENHDLPVIFHAGGVGMDDFYIRGFGTHLETQALGFLITNQAQITSLVIQGVPEKFPDLDMIFVEAGITYVPYLMARLDDTYLRQPDEAPLLDKLPSEYMKEFYYGTQPLEYTDIEFLEDTIQRIGGPDQIMFATDWPHRDHDETNAITDLPFLSDLDKEKILGKNAREVFGI